MARLWRCVQSGTSNLLNYGQVYEEEDSKKEDDAWYLWIKLATITKKFYRWRFIRVFPRSIAPGDEVVLGMFAYSERIHCGPASGKLANENDKRSLLGKKMTVTSVDERMIFVLGTIGWPINAVELVSPASTPVTASIQVPTPVLPRKIAADSQPLKLGTARPFDVMKRVLDLQKK